LATGDARPRWKTLVFTLATVALVLAGVELILALAGVRPMLAEEDPYVGFAGNVPLFVEQTPDGGGPLRATARNKLRFFNHQTFAARKPDDAVRIFCLGGSTTYGRPYDDTTSF
jgi:hypothetical protein